MLNETGIWRNLIIESVGYHLGTFGFELVEKSRFRREQGDFFNTFLMIFEGSNIKNRLPYLSVLPCIGIGSTKIQMLIAELSQKKIHKLDFVVGGSIDRFTKEKKYKEYHIYSNEDANLFSYLIIETIDNVFLPLCEKLSSIDALYDFINDRNYSRLFATVDYVWRNCSILIYKKEFDQAKTFLLKYAEDIGDERTTAALELIDGLAEQN
jgi:hypothetical protein